MSNQLDLKKRWDYTSEEELTQIYQEQYNDVFSKILLLTSTQFMNVLEKQIITYLYIIKKQPMISLLTRVSEYFIQKFYEDREKVYQAYQIIKQTNTNDLEYLDKLNCYLHCPHASGAYHTCKNSFILCNDYIFCLQCKKVYNEDQAKMFCDFCGVEYYTKLREIDNDDLENYFPVCYENPHCLSEKEEKIKCKNCREELCVDISKFNKNDDKNKKIENLYCHKCKMNFKVKDLDTKCKKCNKKFISDVKIFNEFNSLKTDYLCLVHTLLKRKYAVPKNAKKKLCKCELLTFKKYKHNNDKGVLLEGLRYGKKVIICNKCFKIFNYYNFNWSCPECGCGFNGNNNTLLSKELSETSSMSNKIEQQDKNNLKQKSKYNTSANSSNKVKNIYPNNKSELKNGKININNNGDKNNFNEANNDKGLRNSQKVKDNFSDRATGNYYNNSNNNSNSNNNTFDKENKNSNVSKHIHKNNNLNNNNVTNINSNRSNVRDNKKIINKVTINEDTPALNINDKNNQTCNSLINSINSSIKLKNNFNDKNYNNNNNKTMIITFNGTNPNINTNNDTNSKEKKDNNSTNNSMINKSNFSKGILNTSKLFSPEGKNNEKPEYSMRYVNNSNNNYSNNNKEKLKNENNKNDGNSKRNYNYPNNNNEQKGNINSNLNSIGNSKNKRKITKNGELNENNVSNNNILNKVRKNTNRENNNNVIKIDLGSNETTLTPAKSSINIHSMNNNLNSIPTRNNFNNNNNSQFLRGKNDQNKNAMKSPQKNANNLKKQPENSKPEVNIIKRNYSSDKNKKDNHNNIKNNNNNVNKKNINNRNKRNQIDDNINNANNISKNNKVNENMYNSVGGNLLNEDSKAMSNSTVLNKNQSVILNSVKNNNNNISTSQRKINNKMRINDNNNAQNANEEKDRFKNLGEKIIKRSRGSPNHKRVDIVQTSNNNSMIKNNIETINNINVKTSYDFGGDNNNLNKSQNGKDLKDNKNINTDKQSIPMNRSINLASNISEQYKKNNNNNNNVNNISMKNKVRNKNSNTNSIDVIQQEENEDEASYDYNVTKSINYSSSKSTNQNNQNINMNNMPKNKLAENRYNNFNDNNQITTENNIFINDREEKEKEKDKEKEKEKDKLDNIPTKPIINSIYVKNNKDDSNNKLYKNTNINNVNLNSINNLPINNESSKNISSEGYQFNCDNYNVVQLLGEGTFGKIYLVEDPTNFQKYALKKISVSDMEELSENKKEFELLMKLSQDNPDLNVVKIFGIQVKKLDKFNLVMYVLMEAAQCDWECEIRNRNQYQAFYTEEELMKILKNLVTTLSTLQKQGICHRDVKPQNILCFGKDNYKLSDFGEAKKKKKRKINGNCIYDFEGDTSKQTVRGTELYMSPILFKALHDCPEIDLEYNAYKSDVFSLGLCMLLSSTLGFQALYDIRELYDNNKVKRIVESSLTARYSKEYIKLIVSMLQIKEKNRPDFIELETIIQNNYYNSK